MGIFLCIQQQYCSWVLSETFSRHQSIQVTLNKLSSIPNTLLPVCPNISMGTLTSWNGPRRVSNTTLSGNELAWLVGTYTLIISHDIHESVSARGGEVELVMHNFLPNHGFWKHCFTVQFDHISPVLQKLHWLLVRELVHFKILLLVWKIVHPVIWVTSLHLMYHNATCDHLTRICFNSKIPDCPWK